MLNPVIGRAIAVLIAAGSVACASTKLTVRKVTDTHSPPGIRYSLPKPFLVIVPNASGDGGFTTEVVYLPDECQTYAVDARTKRGKYQLDVTVKDGLLSKVVWNTKDAQAATVEGIRVGGELLKGEMDRRTKKEEEESKKREETVKAFEDALQKLETDLDARELAVELARAKVASAEAAVQEDPSPPNKAALRSAELELRQAIITRDALLRTLEDKRATGVEIPGSALDDPSAKKAAPGAAPPGESKTTPKTTFWGPLVYAIVESEDTVELVAVDWTGKRSPKPCAEVSSSLPAKPGQAAVNTGNGASASVSDQQRGVKVTTATKQVEFETVRLETTKPEPKAPKLKGQNVMSMAWPTTGNLELTLELDGAFKQLLQDKRTIRRLTPTAEVLEPSTYNALTDSTGRSVKVVFNRRLSPGTYQLAMPFTYATDLTSSITIELTIEAEAKK